MEKDQDEFGIESIAYDELEKQFQEVLASLYADQSLDRFRVEYQKIHKALKSSHEQEKKLLSKCRELSRDILAGATRVQHALRFSNDDSQTISYLKSELTKTYKFLELSREHEQTSKQNIEKRKLQMKRLQTILQQNQTLTEGQVATVHEYMATNEELSKEKQILQVSVQSNTNQLQVAKTRIVDSVAGLQKMKKQYADLLETKVKEQAKVREQQQNKKRKKQDLQTIKVKFDIARNIQNQAKQGRKALNLVYKEKLAELHHYEMSKEKEKKIQRKLNKQIQIEERKINQITQIIDGLQELSDSKEKDLDTIQYQLHREQQKAETLKQTIKQVNQKIEKIKIQKEETQKLKDVITNGMTQLENQISNQKKNAQKDRSFIDKLKRDRDVYQKEIERADITNRKLEEEFKTIQKVIKQKQNEIFGQKKQVQRLNKMIMALEKEKDSYAFQATSAQAKHFYSRDEVKLRDNFIAQFQKQHLETQAKLKKQQSLYEAVRGDRNLVSKNLASIQEENEEYKQRYRMVNYQITQLNEQIVNKQMQLINQHGEHKKKDKKIQEEAKKIQKFQKQVKQKEDKIKNYLNDIKKLYAIIKENESEKQKLQEQYQLVVAERDILGTQLIRRSAEADLLYEKIKINQSTLAKGEAQYSERLQQIDKKKNTIAELMNDIKGYKNQTSNIADLKSQIHTLNRQLTESRLKVKTLSEELENPMNVHRWRKLQATDSLAYQLMTKIHSIQRRLISKNDQVGKKQLQINQKEKQIKQLQQILKRQPSIQQQKLIPVYEDTLQQKQQQMRAMQDQIEQYTEALEMDQIQMNNLKKRLDQFKKKIHYQKKRQQQSRDDQQKQTVIHVHLPDKRFTGGGFNLSG